MERFARDKHSGLLRKFLNYGPKSFITLATVRFIFASLAIDLSLTLSYTLIMIRCLLVNFDLHDKIQAQ